jgi:hypothetical protein
VATGRSMLVIIWQLLADPDARYTDPGSDFYDTRVNPEHRKRNHIRQLEASATRSPSNPRPDHRSKKEHGPARTTPTTARLPTLRFSDQVVSENVAACSFAGWRCSWLTAVDPCGV